MKPLYLYSTFILDHSLDMFCLPYSQSEASPIYFNH